MKFEIDEQTITDLDIYNEDVNAKSIAGLFCGTKSFVGRNKVYELLGTPLADYDELKERSEAIKFFFDHEWFNLQLDTDVLSFVEYYQKQRRNSMEPIFSTVFLRRVYDKLNQEAQYFLMAEGVRSTVEVLRWVNDFMQRINQLDEKDIPSKLLEQSKRIKELFAKNGYDKLVRKKKIGKYIAVGKLDYKFRIPERRDILFCLDLVSQYDAFSTIARVTKENGFTFANLHRAEDSRIEIEGLFHPLLENPISNDFSIDRKANVLFLSGPNMAGKSTLLKSLAVATFLAHAGFPVPASKMNISILSGLCAAINIADDLSSGYSHFYAEVMSVKQVAEKLKKHKNMLVIFDELFRGTNVKDAYDGTSAVIRSFSKVREAFFVMSTHIVEVADELKDLDNIKFGYMNIDRKNGHPSYTYKLKEGISKDRLGMYIIEQEGVIDLIDEISKE